MFLELNISYSEGGIGEEISFVERGDADYTEGEKLTIREDFLWRDRTMIITGVSKHHDAESGWSVHVQGRTLEYEVAQKAPKVTETYMSLSEEEQQEFEEAGGAKDYVARIKTSDEYGCGGWTSRAIITHLADSLDLTIQTNLPTFDVRNYSVSPSQSYFNAILGLVSVFDPVVFLEGTCLYLFSKDSAGLLSQGLIDVKEAENVSVIRKYKPVPECFMVEGIDGKYMSDWDPFFVQGKRGNTVIEEMADTVMSSLDPSRIMMTLTTKVTYYLDERDKNMCVKQVEEKKIIYATYVTVRNRITVDNVYYDGHHAYPDTLNDPVYSNPILYSTTTKREEYLHYSWVTMSETTTTYFYSDVWDLESQTTEIEKMYIQAESSDDPYVEYNPAYHGDQLNIYLNYGLELSSKEDVSYRSLSESSYSIKVVKTVYSHDGLNWNGTTDSSLDIVVGSSSPRDKPSFHKSTTFATNCVQLLENVGISDIPTEQVNIPCPSWEDVQTVYNWLYPSLSHTYSNIEVTVPKIIDPLPFQRISSIDGVEISGTGLDYYVNNYSVIKDGEGYRTVIRGEARSE